MVYLQQFDYRKVFDIDIAIFWIDKDQIVLKLCQNLFM